MCSVAGGGRGGDPWEGEVCGKIRRREVREGVEMEETEGAHSGWFANRPVFSCTERRRVFVPTHIRPDARFTG